MEKNIQKKESRQSEKIRGIERRFRRGAAVLTALVLVIAIFGTLLAYRLPWSYDMTTGGLFTLSDGTREILSGLTAPVRIGAVYASGKEESMIRALLEQYDGASDLVKVEFLDAQAAPALLANYNIGDAKTVSNGTIIVNSGSRYQLLNDDTMYTYGNNGNIFYGEQDITGAIRYVTTEELPVVYFSTGHGETAMNDMSEATGMLQNAGYEVRQLAMIQDDIPADAAALVMPSPTEDISEYEYDLLTGYLAGGGRLLLLLDPILTAEADAMERLGAIAAEFGLDVSNNYVTEQDDSYHLGTSALYLIPRYGDHDIVRPLAEAERLLILPIARSISTLEHDANSIGQSVLLASSSDAWARYDLTVDSTVPVEGDAAGPLALAVAATRNSGKTGVAQSRIVVVGDGSFAVGTNATAQANGDFLVNSVDWLCDSKITVSVPGKVINANSMLIRGSDFTRLVVLCCAVVPLILFLGALLIWRSRRNK